MKYKIVAAKKIDELTRLVQALIDQGWRPQGGIAVAGMLLMQAMICEDGM